MKRVDEIMPFNVTKLNDASTRKINLIKGVSLYPKTFLDILSVFKLIITTALTLYSVANNIFLNQRF